MKFFTILLLASLACTSLADLQESENEMSLTSHTTDAAMQVTPSNQPKKDDISNSQPKKDDISNSQPKKDDISNCQPKKDDISNSQPKKDDISNEDLSKEASIAIEKHISQEEVVIKSVKKLKHPQSDLLHHLSQEKSLISADLPLEATTEHAPTAATTSEGKLAKHSYDFGKKVKKEVKKAVNYLKNLFPRTYEVVKP